MTLLKIQLAIVRAFNKRTDLSMRQLSIQSGVPYSTLWNLWNTKFNPSLETLIALARALDLKVDVS